VKAEDHESEPSDEGGDAACWMHEFEAELLGESDDPPVENEPDA
jgi:hypothetical protein